MSLTAVRIAAALFRATRFSCTRRKARCSHLRLARYGPKRARSVIAIVASTYKEARSRTH